MDYIKGKNILLLCYNFFDYDKVLQQALYNLGAKNVYLKNAAYFASSPRDDMFWSPWYKAPLYYLKNPMARTNWTEQFKKEIADLKFDVFLVIENTSFKKSFMAYLRKQNPNIKTIWFLWDTFKVQQKYHKDYIGLFDKVYSFDREDAYKYGLSYYPNFYVKPEGKPIKKYDICFVGSANSKVTSYRIPAIAKIKSQCDNLGMKSFFYIKRENIYRSKSLIKRIYNKLFPGNYQRIIEQYKNEDFLHTNSLPPIKYNSILRDSSIIVDLNYSNRQGMTLNAVTAIASGKKLITTNSKIANELFYHPNNILIIDENNPYIDPDFIKSEIVPINMDELEVGNWLKHIINT